MLSFRRLGEEGKEENELNGGRGVLLEYNVVYVYGELRDNLKY